MIIVKIIKIDGQGKIGLSRKEALSDIEKKKAEKEQASADIV
jgi:predicted RNA-binding protein with RPS1 domain